MAETILAKMAVEVSAKTAEFGKALARSQSQLKDFQGTVSGVSNFLKGALASIGAAALGREIINVTSEFQKFGAVLTNTLGSNSAAQIALRDIEEFAKRTPFAVDELTSSYVKLANQGFKPTTEELRKLGDLSASTGKGFDQLTEAIIDAQTGEFERLKEFGIRASKSGDQVKFTFKGVETQTKFTSQAIRDYILSLGDAEGVSGAMAAISGTLGGQISNLGDSWTQLLKTIGDGNKGPLSGAIKGLTELIDKAKELVKTNNQVKEELQVEGQSTIVEELKELVSITGDVDSSAAKLISRLEEEKEAIVNQAAPLFANFEAHEDEIKILEQKASVIEAQITAINDYTKAEQKRVEAAEEANKKEKASIGIIGDIEKQLKTFEDQKKKSFSTAEIASFNVKIEELRGKLDVLNASRPLSNFGKQVIDKDAFDFEVPKIDVAETVDGGTQGFFALPPIDVDARVSELEQITDAYLASAEAQRIANVGLKTDQDDIISRQELMGQTAKQFGDLVVDAAYNAIGANNAFVKAISVAVKKFIELAFAESVAGTIAGAAKTKAPPPVILALAAAGVAGITAMFSKIRGGGGGGGGGGAAGMARTSSSASSTRQEIQRDQIVLVDGEFRLRGGDLILALDKAHKTRQRTG